MTLAVDSPLPATPTPSSSNLNGCASQSATSHSDSPRIRPGTPLGLIQNIFSGRSSSPFSGRPLSGSGLLSRRSSSRSLSGDSNGKRNSLLKQDGAANDTAMSAAAGNTMQGATSSSTKPATSTPIQPSSFSQHGPSHVSPDSPRVVTQQKPPEAATLAVSSPGISSNTSTLSVNEMDEDLDSTRTPSLFEDMDNSQLTTSTDASEPREDLPESLRLMRVAQRRGIKVVDFAFEGPKREGAIEDWAWEGGAACKGFGIGFGGGAYSGPLRKYKPPPKESPDTPEEDKMEVDSSPSPQPSIFSRKPSRPRPLSLRESTGASVERPLNSPSAQPQDSSRESGGISRSGFLQYLQQRQAASLSNSEQSSIKRERSFASTEQGDSSPLKKRSLG